MNFKKALIEFFLEHWGKDEMAVYIGEKKINVNYEFCDSFEVIDDKVIKLRDYNLTCQDHEEADTKIIYHVCKIEEEAKVVLKCNDTDILVIMLGNMDKLSNKSLKIWMETGVGNNLRHINLNELYEELGKSVSKALPGLHALTGCDYNPAFFGKGKKEPLKKMQKSEKFQKAFINLANTSILEVENKVFPELEEFVCTMNGIKNSKEVNKGRFEIFTNTYTPKNIDEAFYKKVKNCDASKLPPCQSELYQQLYRTFFITKIWTHAHLKNPTDLNPLDCGWIENEGGETLDFLWFEGKQFPETIKDVMIQPPDTSNNEDYILNEDEDNDENSDEEESYSECNEDNVSDDDEDNDNNDDE